MPARKPARRYHSHRGDGGKFAPRPATAPVQQVNPSGTFPTAINPFKMAVEQQGWLAGATPGWWISDHLEELRHFVSWIYVGVHKIAQQWAQAKVCVYDASTLAAYDQDAEKAFAGRYGVKALGLARRMRRYRTKANLPDVVAEQEEPIPDHPAATKLDDPNPYTSGRVFRYQVACQIRLTGGAYIWEVPNQYGEPEHLWVIPRGWVRPIAPTVAMPNGAFRITPVFNTFTQNIVSPSQTMWIIPFEQMISVGWPNPLYPGEFTSPLAACSRIIDIMEQTDTATWSSFINAVKPSLVFNIDPKGPGGVPREQMERFVSELEAFKAGSNNHGKILAMLGLTVQQLMAGPSELDYVAGRKQLQEQVLSIQGVPPVMVGQPVGSYSEAAVQAKAAVEFSVEPDLANFGDKLTHRWRKVWGEDFRIELTAKAMDDPTLLLQKTDKILAGHAVGVVSDNEARASLDLPPLDDPIADIPKCLLEPMVQQVGSPDTPIPGMGDESDPYAAFESEMVDMQDEPASDTSTGIKNPLMQAAGGAAKRFDLSLLTKGGHDVSGEPRVPAGSPDGGRWTVGGAIGRLGDAMSGVSKKTEAVRAAKEAERAVGREAKEVAARAVAAAIPEATEGLSPKAARAVVREFEGSAREFAQQSAFDALGMTADIRDVLHQGGGRKDLMLAIAEAKADVERHAADNMDFAFGSRSEGYLADRLSAGGMPAEEAKAVAGRAYAAVRARFGAAGGATAKSFHRNGHALNGAH